jgi:hypothetical protein
MSFYARCGGEMKLFPPLESKWIDGTIGDLLDILRAQGVVTTKNYQNKILIIRGTFRLKTGSETKNVCVSHQSV